MVLAPVLAAAMLASCAPPDPSSLSYLDDEITITGLEADDFTITVRELIELDTVEKKAEALRSNGDVVKTTAVGPTIDTFLAKYGKDKTEFSSVRFTATDGYSIAVPKEILDRREVVLSYMNGAEAYPKEVAPLRAIVIGERAMYWARMVNKIAFETGTSDALTNKVVFLETALPALNSEYSEEESGDIVSTADLLAEHGGAPGDVGSGALGSVESGAPGSVEAGGPGDVESGGPGDGKAEAPGDGKAGKVFMSAYDGLKKNETIDNFLKGYIKYTGDNIPQFCSPDLPEGMNMNGIVTIRTGMSLYVSLERGSEIWKTRTGGGKSGVGFSDIVKDQGFDRNGVFQMMDAEGNVSLYSEHEIVNGVFAKDGDVWCFFSDDREPVRAVLSVEVVTPGA
jgi:hypothetical protein